MSEAAGRLRSVLHRMNRLFDATTETLSSPSRGRPEISSSTAGFRRRILFRGAGRPHTTTRRAFTPHRRRLPEPETAATAAAARRPRTSRRARPWAPARRRARAQPPAGAARRAGASRLLGLAAPGFRRRGARVFSSGATLGHAHQAIRRRLPPARGGARSVRASQVVFHHNRPGAAMRRTAAFAKDQSTGQVPRNGSRNA